MPEHPAVWPTPEARDVVRWLREAGTRRQRRRVARVAVRAAAAALVVAGIARVAGLPFVPSLALVALIALVPAIVEAWRLARSTTLVDVARDLEQAHPGFDNLLVTAAELAGTPSPRTGLAPAVAQAASARLHRIDLRTMDDGRRVLGVCVVLLAAAVFVARGPDVGTREPAREGEPAAVTLEDASLGQLRVEVTPPDYLAQAPSSLVNPARLELPAGSRVAIAIDSSAPHLDVIVPGDAPLPVTGAAPSRTAVLTASASTVWTLRALAADGAVLEERLLPVAVVDDRLPSVRIAAPARDQVFPDPTGRVAIGIEAVDDHGLGRLALRYTRVTGSGETFTFTEGEMPVRVDRRSTRDWRGAVEIDLGALGLEVGDTLVYRAAARDRRPGAVDALSDSFLIEIGGMAGAASGGFTLPEDEHRHAISQQMVIVKTESLHAARAKMTPEDALEESHHLAAEQRMVRAEFVFMTGGHVHDEVEEAEASHEIAEGRFENEAMVEMLSATSHMSRAERLLIDGNTGEALVAERLALKALQAAFDRRRYFLRTTPERSRIDLDRRLSGSLDDARSWVREAEAAAGVPEGLAALEAALRLVDRASDTPSVPLADVARALAAIDAAAADVQDAVARLGAAGDGGARREALAHAATLLRARAARWLAPASESPVEGDAARGYLRGRTGGGPR
ncbi:MAG: hypothetical protein Q8L86_10880 [Vicinamibacterales bacterium]|nr:hypothetical protein [Vicinamibacterales bacterium]